MSWEALQHLWATLQWRAPIWLWLIPLLPLLWWAKGLWQRHQQAQFADPALWPWLEVSSGRTPQQSLKAIAKKIISPAAMLAWGWLFLMIALAGPRSLQNEQKAAMRNGVDILVVMDLSRSMEAKDVSPSRFEFAKAWVSALSQQLAPSDRIGLLAYQAYPHLVAPLTRDKALFAHFLGLIHPDMMPTRGSRLRTALVEAHRVLKQTAEQPTLLLVFTNGQPDPWLLQPEPQGYAQLNKEVIPTEIFGVGTPQAVPLFEADHKKLRVNGLLVQTRLEEAFLQKIAQQVGGDYQRLTASHAQQQQLLEQIQQLAKPLKIQENQAIWQDHSFPFILAAFLAFLWAWFPISMRLQSSKPTSSTAGLGILAFSAILGVFSFALPQPSVAADGLDLKAVQQAKLAYQAYQNHDYELATQLFDEVGGFFGWFNAGDAAYRNKDYESAVFYFRQAFKAATSDEQRAKALYNLGNTYFVTNLLDKAIEAYQGALRYQPDNPKAHHNLALAEARLKLVLQGKGKQKKGKGGGKNRDEEGAFFGGQKPSENPEPGKGGEGDLENVSGKFQKYTRPDAEDATQYGVSSASSQALKSLGDGSAQANAILEAERQQQIVADLEQQLKQVSDKQAMLLKRIFEREEGYMAPQAQPHQMKGIQPW